MYNIILVDADEKGRLGEEDCKRFRSQYDPSVAYSAMWAGAGKWGAGGVPGIKEEKPLSGGSGGGGHQTGHQVSPVTSPGPVGDSPLYNANFPGAGGNFTNSGSTNTTQSAVNQESLLYETMSQVYPALSSSLGKPLNKPDDRISNSTLKSYFQFPQVEVTEGGLTSTPGLTRTLNTPARTRAMRRPSTLTQTTRSQAPRRVSARNNDLVSFI